MILDNTDQYRTRCFLGLSLLVIMLTFLGLSQTTLMNIAFASEATLFSDGFLDDAIGGEPSLWEVEDPQGTSNVVVEDSALDSGRALHILAGPIDSARLVGIKTPPWKVEGEDAKSIAIDMKINHVRGSHLAYVNAGTILIHWKVNSGKTFIYDNNHTIGKLNEGWNHIRIVANRETNEAFVYLNDMEAKGYGPFSLRNQPDTWEGAILRLAHAVGPEATAEAFFGDLQISIVDAQ